MAALPTRDSPARRQGTTSMKSAVARRQPGLADVLGVCPLCGQESQQNGEASTTISRCSRPDSHGGHAARSPRPSSACSSTNLALLTAGNSEPACGPHSTVGPALQLCSLMEGRRTLLALSTWATAGVKQLWMHFKEHLAAQAPLPSPPDTPGTPPVRRPADTTSGRPPSSPISLWRRPPALRPPPEPPPRTTPPRVTTIGQDSRPQRTHPLPSATQWPRSHRPLWTDQEGADNG